MSLTAILDERQHLITVAIGALVAHDDPQRVVHQTYLRWYGLSAADRAHIRVPRVWLTRVARRISRGIEVSGRGHADVDTNSSTVCGKALPDKVTEALDVTVDLCDRLLLDRSNAHSLDSSPSIDRHLPAPAGGLVEPGSDDPPFSKRAARVVRAFRIACQAGNRVGLAATLAPDVTVVTDSGGKVRIARHVVRGVDHVSRFLVTLLARQRAIGVSEHAINGQTGLVFRRNQQVAAVISLNIHRDRVRDVWIVLNPDKLRRWNRP
jgi:RNA polymerase sigma-70 factor, ECF subfamily